MAVSMRPADAARKLDAAGMRAAEDKGFLPGRPSWSSSTTNWGLRAYRSDADGPAAVDMYIGDGSNRASEFDQAFRQARADMVDAQRSQQQRAARANAALSRTLSNFSRRNAAATSPLHREPGSDRYVGGGPKCRAHTREFCVPSTDTHAGVFMGYVDPVDVAHAMTADGFNVRGVNLPLIGQPVASPDQGLAKQPRNERLAAAEHKWHSVWGGKQQKGQTMQSKRSISVLETRKELDNFNRRLDQTASPGAGIATLSAPSGSVRQPRLELPAVAVLATSRQPTSAMVGRWVAEVERKDSSPSKCKFELRLSLDKKGRVVGAGRQSLNGKQWVCRVSSVNMDGHSLKLRLVFGLKDKEEWFGDLADGQAGEETEPEPERAACYMMQARTKDWLSTPFRLTRASSAS